MRRTVLSPPLVACLAVCLALASCGGSGGSSSPTTPPSSPTTVERGFDFAQGNGGWLWGHADYGPQTAPLDVITEIRPLPAPSTGSGFFSSGTNRSDDLFIYIKTKISGLSAGTRDRVAAEIQFLTDAPSGCVGVGGAPGESVWIVAAVSTAEPVTVFNGSDYRVNLDRGNQSQSGRDGIVLGDIANGVTDCSARRWEPKTLATPSASPLIVQADERGEAWFLAGFDSGFEALSRIYYRRITVRLVPLAP